MTYQLVTDNGELDLAAMHGHHIAGTSYHWHHGWIPRDRSTAAQYGKKLPLGKGKTAKFFNEEPEEFNQATQKTPKFITSPPAGDTKPVMKYHGSKILTGTSHTSNGKTIKIAKVSQSGTHVMDENGDKHKISNLKGKTRADNQALANYKVNKYKKSIQTFQIQSSFKPTPQAKPIPKKYTPEHTPAGSVYSAPAHIYHTEPEFPHSESTAPNIKGRFTPSEKHAIVAYTGSAYASINGGLRAGKDNGHKDSIAALDSAIAKSTPLKQGTYLHRGMNVAAIATLQPGDSFVDKGYASTSRSPNLHLAKQSTRIHVETTSPKLKALDVSGVSQFPHEHEVMLPRSTKFTVIRRVEHGGHTHLYVHAEPGA